MMPLKIAFLKKTGASLPFRLFLLPALLISGVLASLTVQADSVNSRAISSRIINGDASDTAYSWMVSIRVKGNSNGHFCGGSLIDSRWVLSAAHCFADSDPDEEYEVVVNNLVRTTTNTDYVRTIKNVIIHPDFNGQTFKNDLALLELESSISAATISLGTASHVTSAGSGFVQALGWGVQEAGASTLPTTLREVDLNLISGSACTSLGASSSSPDSSQLCAGIAPNGGKDSCQGDSGGPLVYANGSQWVQLGVVSWGDGCAEAGKYGVYSNVAYFSSWITAVINGLSISGQSVPSLYNYFGLAGTGKTLSRTITLKNNSLTTAATLSTFSLSGSASSAFTLSESCPTSLAAQDSCTFVISLKSGSASSYSATMLIDSSLNDISFGLSGDTVQADSTLSSAFDDNSHVWYSGGNSAWALDKTKIVDFSSTLKPGAVYGGGSSLLTTYVSGGGTLSYQILSAMSDDEVLAVYVDNELIDYYIGDAARTNKTWPAKSTTLSSGDHQVIYAYGSYASAAEAAESKLWLASFKVTGGSTTTTGNAAIPVDDFSQDGGGGGGALGTLSLGGLIFLLIQKKRKLIYSKKH